jgi:protein-S-isoprenylcysteine O-methyltransferase Ste14
VPLGFLTAAAFIILAQPRTLTLIIGCGVSLIGLAIRACAAVQIRKNNAIATTGPYAYTRNPLYLGSFIVGLGFSIGAGRWLLAVVFALLFGGIYLPVMRVEASTLRAAFGAEYDDYAREVPLFIPWITPYRKGEITGFDRRLYLRYREYRAALGLLIAWGLLAFKAYYLK